MALGKKTGGRRKGTPNKGISKPYKQPPPDGMQPLAFLMAVMQDTDQTIENRIGAAKSAAPYIHRALKSVEHSGEGGGPIKQRVVLTFA